MTTEEQQIQTLISNIWTSTDAFLATHNNSLLLFDFTTVSYDEDKVTKIKSIYRYKIKDYPEKLGKYFEKHGFSIPDASNDEPTLNSIPDTTSIELIDIPQNEIYDPKTITQIANVGIDTWHTFVKEERIAGQCWTLFKHFFDNDKLKERIEVGVYILLKNSSLSDVENKFIHYEVLKFLWDKGLEYFANSYIEKIKQDEEIERLRNVSASTHVIKTTVNGLFAPPLNSLLQETNVDNRIKELDRAKERLLRYAEVVNLITKLSSNHKDDEGIKESLSGSGLFTINENERGEIKSILSEILELRKSDPSLTSLTFVLNNENLAKDVFVYENEYYPAQSFYELLLLTIIENVVKHGATDEGKLTVAMNLSDKQITFANKPKPNSKREIRVEDMTGNFRVFHTILNRLDLGTFSVSNDNSEFKVTLKAKENG